MASPLRAAFPAPVPASVRTVRLPLAPILEEPAASDTIQLRLQKFIETVKDEQKKDQVAGVFAAGILAAPVVQQPADNLLYVSTREDVLTQFRLAQRAGSTGLLAHNYLAGGQFFNLKLGAQVYLIYSDGSYRTYEVYAVEDYQALTLTTFRDLSTQKAVGQYPLFDRIYRSKDDRLVFQTCIEKDGRSSWGRRFILAAPVP